MSHRNEPFPAWTYLRGGAQRTGKVSTRWTPRSDSGPHTSIAHEDAAADDAAWWGPRPRPGVRPVTHFHPSSVRVCHGSFRKQPHSVLSSSHPSFLRLNGALLVHWALVCSFLRDCLGAHCPLPRHSVHCPRWTGPLSVNCQVC